MTLPNNPLPDPEFIRLQEEYRNEIPQKLNELSRLIRAVRSAVTAETLRALRLHVHRLAGNAETFGYMEVGVICKQWDKDICQKIEELPHSSPDSKWLMELDLNFKKIKENFY